MKTQEKSRAGKLRSAGASYSDILKVVKVSKSTLSHWLKDIALTKSQLVRLKGRQKSRIMGAKANQAAAQMRRSETEEGAKSEVGLLIRNPLFLSGLMLYWAEGVKDGNSVVFTNSDPNLIALMMSWFRDICKVSESKFRAIVFIHEFQVNENWLMFWRKITKLSKRQFYPPQVKPTIAKKKRNKLYNGTCAIKIYDAMLASRIRGWKQGIIELIHEE